MSVSQDTAEANLYCEVEDVARYVEPSDVDDETFGAGTNPSEQEVISHIEAACAEIDRRTQQSWRANTVTDEVHDHGSIYYWLSGYPIGLMKKNIHPLDSESGDKLEVYDGNSWNDWLTDSNLTSGRDNDYWLDRPNGILWVFERAILNPHPKFRVTYRYGYDNVPADVREAAAKLAAADIASGDFYGTQVPGNNRGENADPAKMADKWREQAEKTIQTRKKISWV